ncbi:hypothetical protein BDV3_001013 [Batrachochytrium dendrobatidis]
MSLFGNTPTKTISSSMFQTPLLHVPTKHTDDVDFAPAFRQYIVSAYAEDPDTHAAAIAALNRARQDIRGCGKDITGRDILYRYYGQLELLDLRFPIDGKTVTILFNWYDAFTSKQVSQYSIAYEKASVIFNIAATCSSIGALQNRFDLAGLKVAFNYFQASAGLFQYINDNFLHPPSVDMSRNSVKCLGELMLAQAQECFLEKVLIEKKQGLLVAKLAAQIALVYSTVLDGFGNPSLKGQFDKSWFDLVKIKSNHFQALAHYHKSIQLETENQYGELTAHATAADTIATNNIKLAEQFVSAFPSFTVSKEIASTAATTTSGQKTSDATAVLDMAKSLAKIVGERKQTAIKDNELIYHATVPDMAALPPIEKLNAVKPIPFADLCTNGRADISLIIGRDIFQALVPLSVHESSSLYSEEKAKLLRGEQDRVKEADADLQVTFDSLNMVPTLNRLKNFLRADPHTSDTLDINIPKTIIEACNTVRAEETDRTKIDYILSLINASKIKSDTTLSELAMLLDKEQYECETNRVKYMDQWTMEPSFKLVAKHRKDLREYCESSEKAKETDKVMMKQIEGIQGFLALFTCSIKELEKNLADAVVSAGGSSMAAASTGSSQNISLLDECIDGTPSSDGLGALGEQIVLEKIDGILQRLRALKKARSDLVEDLKQKLHNDDVSSLLLLNKGREQHIFQTELFKFRPLQSKIDSNLESHAGLLKDVTNEFHKLLKSSQAMKVLDLRENKRNQLISQWSKQFGLYKEIKSGLAKGIEFYKDLETKVGELRELVVGFVNRRSSEVAALIKLIDSTQAEKGQAVLKEQLRQLSVSENSQASIGHGVPGSTGLQQGQYLQYQATPPPPAVSSAVSTTAYQTPLNLQQQPPPYQTLLTQQSPTASYSAPPQQQQRSHIPFSSTTNHTGSAPSSQYPLQQQGYQHPPPHFTSESNTGYPSQPQYPSQQPQYQQPNGYITSDPSLGAEYRQFIPPQQPIHSAATLPPPLAPPKLSLLSTPQPTVSIYQNTSRQGPPPPPIPTQYQQHAASYFPQSIPVGNASGGSYASQLPQQGHTQPSITNVRNESNYSQFQYTSQSPQLHQQPYQPVISSPSVPYGGSFNQGSVQHPQPGQHMNGQYAFQSNESLGYASQPNQQTGQPPSHYNPPPSLI